MRNSSTPSDANRTQSDAHQSWRNEVASRVQNYRTRHQRAEEVAPALDATAATAARPAATAPPATSEPPVRATKRLPARTVASAVYDATSARQAAREHNSATAFDMNYYRRRNAAALAEPVNLQATAHALPEMELDPEIQAESRTQTPETAAVTTNAAELTCDLDLDLRPQRNEGNLDQYRLTPEEKDAPLDANAARSNEIEQEPLEDATPVEPPSNVIVFRSPTIEPPLAPVPRYDELAEPVDAKPRILDVPEDIMPPVQGTLFPEIRLDTDVVESSAPPQPEIEVPLRVAPLGSRLEAALADLGLVAVGGAIFAAAAYAGLPDVPHTKLFWMSMAAVTVLLWAIYQAMFLIYGGKTPGMARYHIELRSFDGAMPSWTQRVRRAEFAIISLASVGLGFLWLLADEDALGWHDRVSQTFPTVD